MKVRGYVQSGALAAGREVEELDAAGRFACAFEWLGSLVEVHRGYLREYLSMVEWLRGADGERVYGGMVPELLERYGRLVADSRRSVARFERELAELVQKCPDRQLVTDRI